MGWPLDRLSSSPPPAETESEVETSMCKSDLGGGEKAATPLLPPSEPGLWKLFHGENREGENTL